MATRNGGVDEEEEEEEEDDEDVDADAAGMAAAAFLPKNEAIDGVFAAAALGSRREQNVLPVPSVFTVGGGDPTCCFRVRAATPA